VDRSNAIPTPRPRGSIDDDVSRARDDDDDETRRDDDDE